jgi:hypothetical protein
MAAPAQPRIAAPAQRAPAQHFAAPHVAAPNPAPAHVAAPMRAAPPHIAAQRSAPPNVARSSASHPNAVTSTARQQQIETQRNGTGPHDLARRGATGAPNAANANKTVPNNPSNAAGSKLATPNKTGPTNTTPSTTAPNVLGQGPQDNRGRNAANPNAVNQQAQTRAQQQAQVRAQIYAGRGRPTLHNAAFANASTRDPAMRALARATFQGTFARDRGGFTVANRSRFRGIVIGWGGPVFWPYAYQDFVDYTFWPYGSDTFWPYAYDDVYDGIFGAYAPDSTAYANVPSAVRSAVPRGVTIGPAAGGTAQVCSGESSGLTDWPIERIAQQVEPTDAQRSLLDQLRDATANAVNLLKSACPTDLPSTPTGRLAAMHQRIATMLQAVQIVRPALDKFYQSLNDEQRERFIALESQGTPPAGRSSNRRQPNLTQACGGSAKQITNLPINRIQQLLHPDQTQRAALDDLNTATAQAATDLNENCAPADQPLTPTGRMAAMEARLNAMLKALDTVQPAMAKFYNSLNDEQKARFDRLGPRQG